MHRILTLVISAVSATVPLSVRAPGQIPEIQPGWMIIEGDMIVPADYYVLESAYEATYWPNGVIPFTFDSAVTQPHRDIALEAIAELEAAAGVDFVTTPVTFIPTLRIRNSTQNSSYVGMQACFNPPTPCFQNVNIANWNKWIIAHELLHALGCWHEQSRPDRDGYVQINWSNIESGQSHNFDVRSGATSYGPYDFDSVMHYGPYSFSAIGQPTITCLPAYQSWQSVMGQRSHLSLQDAYGLAAVYGAPPAPAVTNLPVTLAPAGIGRLALVVDGTRFCGGGGSSGGMQGTQVRWNGTPVPTEFVSAGRVVATVPETLLRQPGIYPITVRNAWPGGGTSAPWSFQLTEGFSKVMITEVSWGDVDGAEICNFDVVPHDLNDWRLIWNDGVPVESFPVVNLVLQPGQRAVFLENVFASIPEMPAGTPRILLTPPQTSSQAFSVALVTDEGTIMDEVRVTNTADTAIGPALGGAFRGRAIRGALTGTTGAVSLERIWGLDSNGGADWTEQPQRSFGLENRSSGPRGSDSLPGIYVFPATVVLNEIDDDPDCVELRNLGTTAVNLQDWFLLASRGQHYLHATIRPFPGSFLVPAGGYVVLGEGAPPPEMPAGTPYVDVLAAGGNFPFNTEEWSCALYDANGTLADLVRTTGNDDLVVHNHPRAPSSWSAFTGAAGRNANSGDQAVGRVNGTDTDRGSDWRPVRARTMGFANGGFAGDAGLPGGLDVRLNGTPSPGGLALIVNAGAANAGRHYSLLSSYSHSQGQGPLLGLAFDALLNWAQLQNLPPWGAILDAQGSFRYDLPGGTLPSFVADHIAILRDPATGALLGMTRVLEEDH